jgi:hypothetical protein
MVDLIRDPADRMIKFVVTGNERVAMTIETLEGISGRWNAFDQLLIRAHLVQSQFIVNMDRLHLISSGDKSEPCLREFLACSL